jgi:hypothetical protein
MYGDNWQPKEACNNAEDSSVASLAPRQLRFRVPGGTETAVPATRCYVENLKPGQAFFKGGFRNAFNTLRRDSIIEAVA